MTRPRLERVVRLTVRDTGLTNGSWAPVRADGQYLVVMPSFVARGGVRFDFLEDLPRVELGTHFQESRVKLRVKGEI